MSDNSHVIIQSNAPQAPSGYGIQASILGRGLAERGFKVSFAANSAIAHVVTEHHGLPVWPYIQMGSNAGGKSIPFQVEYHLEHYGPADVLHVIGLYDLWAYADDIQIVQDIEELESLRWWWWCPFKRWPLFAGDRSVLWAVPSATVVPFGGWAKEKLEAALDTTLPAPAVQAPIPHAAEVAYFDQPTDGLAAAEARRQLGIDHDKTLVVMVAANARGQGSRRKGFAEAFMAFQHLRTRQPGRWHLYVHTDIAGHKGGDNLLKVIEAVGLDGDVSWPSLAEFVKGTPTEQMRDLYWAADQVWMPSRAEGFGVPIIEAMACGTPALTTGAGVSGDLVPVEHRINYVDAWEPQMRCWEAQVDWRHLAKRALDVGRRFRAVNQRERLRRRAVGLYHPDVVCDAWAARLRA